MQTQKSSHVLKSVLTVTTFSISTRAIAFLFKIYLSRTLGAEVMGLYQMALTVFFMFIALSTGGISTVLSRKIAEQNTLEGGDKGLSLLSSSLVLGVGVSLACTGLAYLILPYTHLFITDSRAIPLLKIMLPALTSTTFYIIIRGWFWGNKHFLDFSLSEMIEEILRVLFTLLFTSGLFSAISGQTGLALAFTISDFVVMGVIIATFFYRGGRFTKGSSYKEILKPAMPLTTMKIFGSMVGTAIALILPQGLINGGMSISQATESVGRISAMANPLLFAPNAIITSLAVVLIPEMSERNAKKDYAGLLEELKKGIELSLMISGAFMVIYLSLGRELTTFLYADTPSGAYLEQASILLLIMPLNHILSSALNSMGLEKQNFLSYSVGTILMLIAMVTLPSRIGVQSVIVADFIFLLTTAIGNVLILRKHINGSLGILKSMLMVALFGVPCAYLGNLMHSLTLPLGATLSLIISLVVCFGAYAVMVVTIGNVNPIKMLKAKGKNA